MNEPGGIRASDAEREAVVEALRQASVEGRLTLSELTDRTEAAYLAATQAELAQITADLPGGAAPPRPAGAVAPPSGKARRWFVAVMGDTKRRGKWRIDQEIAAVAVMGDVTIDLRQAEVRTNEIDIVATAVMGNVKIIVPDGVDVDLSGVAVMGDKRVDVQEAPEGMNVPVVRVRAYVLMGDVKIVGDSRAKPIKRSLSDWTGWWLERRGGASPRVAEQLRTHLDSLLHLPPMDGRAMGLHHSGWGLPHPDPDPDHANPPPRPPDPPYPPRH
ncbi:DUF1707 domain-containing protein [Sphaerisporangium sp. TRM90804]|uniref:DUF1707 SHOCT-like domain-containing protein n=1 Tax=Sphaerisporangium sp. TRM90804 TaxID=3031113 RepID=UPI002447EA2A|nr:DUF1707 domain-containing protein [Sphaerisporangium sp. TRM90804]MDH2424222.1 DUF1707 domain-containing protein [Sphaerisporangium sp. TRM90804]